MRRPRTTWRSLVLLRVVFLPKLRSGLVGAVGVARIPLKAEAFKFWKGAEELEVCCVRWKRELRQRGGAFKRREIREFQAVIEPQ